MKKKTVMLIGALPPPVGGVTIHLVRFLHGYDDIRDLRLLVFDFKKFRIFTRTGTYTFPRIVLLFLHADILHIHISSNIKILVAIAGKILRKKVIYTHHNSRIDNMLIFKILFRLVDILILVNNRDIKLDPGIMQSGKTRVIPAFLKPLEIEQLKNDIVKRIENSSFVVSSNCSALRFREEKDIYGFDILLSAFSLFLKETHDYKALLVLVDPSSASDKYVKNLLKINNLTSTNVLHIMEKLDFCALIQKSDAIVRATRTDGDAITVRESLYFRKPVIASDCTWRPDGTITFMNENPLDLCEKLVKAYNKRKANFKKSDVPDFGMQLIEMYELLLK